MHVRMDQTHWSIAKSIQRITAFTWAARITALITTTARTMMQMGKYRHGDSRQVLYAVLWPLWLALGLTVPPTMAAAVSLTPIVPGVFTNGDGANSHWVQLQNIAINSLGNATEALGMTPSDAVLMRSADAVISNINVGNDMYNDLYGSALGAANLVPLFNPGDSNQTNFAGHVWGYLSVPTTGNYNFDVLYDDGFEFTIWGANTYQRLSVDGLNFHDRSSFSSDLEMQPGLYRYDLVGYNGPEVGVLSLGWTGPGISDFTVIPQADLYTSGKGASIEGAYFTTNIPAAVPVPAAVWLFGSGLAGLLGLASHRKRKTT